MAEIKQICPYCDQGLEETRDEQITQLKADLAKSERILEEWKATTREQTRRTNVAGSKAIVYLQEIAALKQKLNTASWEFLELEEREVDLKAALTAVADKEWDEAVEACYSSHTVADTSDRVMVISGGKKAWTAGVAAKKRAIRRLKKGQGV